MISLHFWRNWVIWFEKMPVITNLSLFNECKGEETLLNWLEITEQEEEEKETDFKSNNLMNY